MLASLLANAQTATTNKQKYWDYRDRFKKWFIKAGRLTGESQIMETRAFSNNSAYDTTRGGNLFPRSTSWMQWGDNTTIQLGYYIATLSMEYKLLKKNNQDTKATLAEIYYA